MQVFRGNTAEEMDSHCSQFLLGDKAWQCWAHTVLLGLPGAAAGTRRCHNLCKVPDQIQEESQPLLLWSCSTAAYRYWMCTCLCHPCAGQCWAQGCAQGLPSISSPGPPHSSLYSDLLTLELLLPPPDCDTLG